MRNTPCGVRQRNTTPPKSPAQMGMEPSLVGGSRGFSPLRGDPAAAVSEQSSSAVQGCRAPAAHQKHPTHQKVRSQPPDPN
jgi:hypothetical protein